jgi:tetratricopeptide (TPR) repeat protein
VRTSADLHVLAPAALLVAFASGCSGGGSGAPGATPVVERPAAPATASAPLELLTDGYADPETCGQCHRAIAESYRSVAMAQSFGRPSRDNVIEDYKARNVYEHKPSGFTYEMRQEDGRFLQRRSVRDSSGRPAHVFEREVTFIIGSGRHARSYIHRSPTGEMTMLPVTWYSQEKRWAMSPGFDRRSHSDFSRPITYVCVVCHAGTPAISASAIPLELFPESMPSGIDCQRCHGPGARHVELAQRHDSSFKEVRSSIVNPRRLPADRQMDICMQCHLETTSAGAWNTQIIFGRGVYSFRPGEPLSSYCVHFDQPPGTGHDDKFEIAHQAYRLRQARCFRESEGRLTCLTCHDPHQRPDHPQEFFSAKCLGCHRTEDCGPTRRAAARGGAGPCVTCHMPQRRTEDVIHVTMTDHKIGKHPPPAILLAPRREQETPYRGPVVYYRPEEVPDPAQRDLYLGIANVMEGVNLVDGAALLKKAAIGARPRTLEPYLALGLASMALGHLQDALISLKKGVDLATSNPRALMTYGNALAAAHHPREALQEYDAAVAAWPAYSEALTNAGSILFQSGRLEEALDRYDRAIAIRADNDEACSNRGAVLIAMGRLDEALAALTEALRLDPRHAEDYDNLATALEQKGLQDKALRTLREGHQQSPTDVKIMARLSFAIATRGGSRPKDLREARALAEEAVRLTSRRDARALDALAAALDASGDPGGAVPVAEEAESRASATGETDLAAAIRVRRDGYARRHPVHGP